MRILEIKNNLVKISYDVNDNLALSGFAVIEDTNCPYVAQIVNLKADGGNNYAILKLLFTFDGTGVLKNYNGTIPSEKAQITLLPVEEILKLFRVGSPIFAGNVSGFGTPFCLDLDVFTSGLLICSNNLINTGKLLTNIFPQIVKRNKKVVLLDTTGDFFTENSFVFGKNFKLPLNSEFLDFIFDNDLEGVEPVSKAVIQDIFSEVKDYLQSLPQGYLPIDLFVNVVQEQYNETKIPELVLLKNKLIRYKDANVFATGGDDIFMLRSKIAHTDSVTVDVSHCEAKLMRKLIGFIYDSVATVDADTCMFVNINNDFADKKLLRKTMEYNNIFSTIICSHEFRYLPDLKQIIPNVLFFAPLTNQHDFAGYNTFLSKLNGDEFIVYGEFTHKIPFIVQLAPYDENMVFEVYNQPEDEIEQEFESYDEIPTEAEETENLIEENVTPVLNDDAEVTEQIPEYTEEFTEEYSETEDESSANVETVSTTEDEQENTYEVEQQPVIEEVEKNESISTVSDITFEDEDNTISISSDEKAVFANSIDFKPDDLELSANDNNKIPQDESVSFENDVLSDREILEKQVAGDVEASFYKKVEEENLEDENKINPDVLTQEDEISDEDLDYIDNINSSNDVISDDDDEELEIVEAPEKAQVSEDIDSSSNGDEQDKTLPDIDENIVESSVKQESSQKENNYIPIYTPDEFTKVEPDEEEDAIPTFKPGDVISHPKYGQGVVEKMINYGNKTLCSINFVNLGRRLLDPAISDINLLGREGAVVE